MGFIRGALITLFTIVLFFSLLLMNFSLMVSLSLQHDTLKPALKVSANELFKNFETESIFDEEDYEIEDFIDEIYYAEYDCEFWKCVKNSPMPLVLFSEKAKEYWTGKFLLLLGLSLLLFALIFLISTKRPMKFIFVGILMIITAFPFRNLDWILRFVKGQFSEIFSVFFTQAHSVFIIMLIFGILFILTGILCKIFGWNMKFKKDEEESKVNLQNKKKK